MGCVQGINITRMKRNLKPLYLCHFAVIYESAVKIVLFLRSYIYVIKKYSTYILNIRYIC
ncbi:MAG: hypothetical protein AMS27_01990 [Bacteroides sp. SM23_62_1]|nr:MAG: hypothetical protein AMS27_01990 [Bacteroides sp. SM23_62_1]